MSTIDFRTLTVSEFNALTQSQFEAMPRGLVFRAPFIDDYDDVVSGISGTTNGDPQLLGSGDVPPGLSGGVLLDGDDYITYGDITSLITLSDPWSISIWAKQTGSGDNDQDIIWTISDTADNDNVRLGILGDNLKIGSASETPGIGTTVLTEDGIWRMYTVVWDGTDFTAYINDTLEYDTTPSGSNWQGSTDFSIGQAYSAANDNDWTGSLADPRLYDHALTLQEIQALWAAAMPVTQTGWRNRRGFRDRSDWR